MQQERGLQAAEAWILDGVSEFPVSFFDSLNGEWRYAFERFGTIAAGGRFCGLKAALLPRRLHGYGLVLMPFGNSAPMNAGPPGARSASIGNPNGVVSSSPGLRGTSYPG